MGSQLADPSSFRTVVTSRVITAYQLAGTGSDKISHTSVGTTVAPSDCSSLLRQQNGSCVYSQTRGNSFHLSVQQDTGIISPPGSVCDSSHSHPSSWGPECDSRCLVSSQQSQPNGVAASRGNLTQSVLYLRDPSSGHVRQCSKWQPIPSRDSSSHVYNSQWKVFAKWANEKQIQSKDLSYITLAEYLVHLFAENKQVNTIKVHQSFIASVLRMLNLPTAIQDTIHNIIRRMSILRPRTQEILPKWHLSMVFKELMKPPFAINGSDKNISLELLSYKTAFLVALATSARGSGLIALSRDAHNLEFTTLESGAKHVSIRLAPKFIPKNQCPDLIPKPLEFPGITHLFPQELERLLRPVRALGLYLVWSAKRAKEDQHKRLFVHFSLDAQLFTTHFRRWVAETICLTYKNSSESNLLKVRAHDVGRWRPP